MSFYFCNYRFNNFCMITGDLCDKNTEYCKIESDKYIAINNLIEKKSE